MIRKENNPLQSSRGSKRPSNSGHMADAIIKVFREPPRFNYIDEDVGSNHLISPEESELRIVWLLTAFTLVLSISISFLLIYTHHLYLCALNLSNSSSDMSESRKSRTPFRQMPELHVAILDIDGFLQDFHIFLHANGLKISPSWSMQLPKVSRGFLIGGNHGINPPYSTFVDQSQIFVGYNDGKKLMTRIKSKTFHRTVPQSKFESGFGIVNSVHIGDFLWLIKWKQTPNYYEYEGNLKFLMWSIKKRTFMEMPSFLPAKITFSEKIKSCAINKTSAFIMPVYPDIDTFFQADFIGKAMIIDFSSKSHQFVELSKSVYAESCVLTQDKYGHQIVYVLEEIFLGLGFQNVNWKPMMHVYNLELELWTHSIQAPVQRGILSTILGNIYIFSDKTAYHWSQKQQEWLELETEIDLQFGKSRVGSVHVYYPDHCLQIGSCSRLAKDN